MSFIEYSWEILPVLAQGIEVTLAMTAFSMAIAAILAIPLSLGKIYGPSPVRSACSAYIEFFRGTPLLAQLFIIYYGLPIIGLNFNSFVAAVIGFGLNSAAYQAEYLRGAIQAVQTGQMEAARSMGMNFTTALRRIVLPQAVRKVIPSWSNDVVYTLKYTSVAFMIGAQELTAKGKIMAAEHFRFTETFLLVGIMYLIMVYIFTRGLKTLEKNVSIPGFEMR